MDNKKKEHETIVDKVNTHFEDLEAYVAQIKNEHHNVILSTENEAVKKLGGDWKKYKTYLKSNEGAKKHAESLVDKFYKGTLKALNIEDDSKINPEWKERLLELNGINYDVLFSTIKKTKGEFGLEIYQKNFLKDHVENLYERGISRMTRHIDENHIPSILKHIGADQYMTINDTLKHETYKPSAVNAIIAEKNKKLYESLTSDKTLQPYLIDK